MQRGNRAKTDEEREYHVPLMRKRLCLEELHPRMLKHLKDTIKEPDLLVLRNHREQEKSQKTKGQTPSLFSKEVEG